MTRFGEKRCNLAGRDGAVGREHWLFLVSVVAVALLSWSSVVRGYFRYTDDLAWLVPARTLGITSYAIRLVSQGTPTFNYRPVAGLAFLANHLIFGCNAGGYYALNLVLHGIASLLLYGVVRLALDGDHISGLIAALVFAVHPVHRIDLQLISDGTILATVFASLSLLLFAQYVRCGSPVFLGLAVLTFGLGLLSKEIAAGMVVALVAYALTQARWGRAQIGRLGLVMVPFVGILVVYLVIDLGVVSAKYAGQSMYYIGWHVPVNMVKSTFVLVFPSGRVYAGAVLSLLMGAFVLLSGIVIVTSRDFTLWFCLAWMGATSLPGSLYAQYYNTPPGYPFFVFAYPVTMAFCAMVGVLAGRAWRHRWVERRDLRIILASSFVLLVACAAAFNWWRSQPVRGNLVQVAVAATIGEIVGCNTTSYLRLQQPEGRAQEEYRAALTYLSAFLRREPGESEEVDRTPFRHLVRARIFRWQGNQVAFREDVVSTRRSLGARPMQWHLSQATAIPHDLVVTYVNNLLADVSDAK